MVDLILHICRVVSISVVDHALTVTKGTITGIKQLSGRLGGFVLALGVICHATAYIAFGSLEGTIANLGELGRDSHVMGVFDTFSLNCWRC
jgi:hypothetical protein